MYYLLPFIVGFLIVFSALVNGQVAQRLGTTKGIQTNFLVGAVAALVLALVFNAFTMTIDGPESSSMLLMMGSLFGLGVLFFTNTIVTKISALYVVLLPFIGQMLVSGCIDYFYLDILSKGKIIGALLILAGIFYNAVFERTFEGA
ncbi:MAG: DMT family transporter [Clostridia bacterium]|nr:DMT family transporter [Clostridia bacterium]